MSASVVLDVLLVVILVGYLVHGYRNGLIRSLAGFAGIIAGGIAAYFAIPLVSGWVPAAAWRVPATLAVAVVLVVLGHALGAMVGSALRRTMKSTPVRGIDKMLGAVISGVAAALILSLLAVSIGSLGVPFLSSTIASSQVLQTITSLTPSPVQAFLAQLRSVAVDQGLPLISEAIGGITTSPELPHGATDTPALTRAASSVVRVVGNAYACGQSQSGSGFVVSTNRVITNAHVVAGVDQPVVETPGGQTLTGHIVYFDSQDDLAVIAVNGMTAAPLRLTSSLAPGSKAVTDGYPYGGPYSSVAAQVLSIDTANIKSIYGDGSAPREIYSLATTILSGDSGGPLLDTSGEVAGVVFAKSSTTANLGYAMTMTEVNPVADQAARLSATVADGPCIKG
jgi:S1-C subfamily serine protease